jgi:hypothetical protein
MSFGSLVRIGALAYADDIVILAPTANAARRLLDTYDVFASEYCVKSNGSKSKCNPILFYTGKCSRSAHVNTEFSIGGHVDDLGFTPHQKKLSHQLSFSGWLKPSRK